MVQVLDPGVALLCVGEVLLALALEQLPAGLLGAPGVSHPHPPTTVRAAGRPARPLKQRTVLHCSGLCNFVFINVEVKKFVELILPHLFDNPQPTCMSQGSVLQGKYCLSIPSQILPSLP